MLILAGMSFMQPGLNFAGLDRPRLPVLLSWPQCSSAQHSGRLNLAKAQLVIVTQGPSSLHCSEIFQRCLEDVTGE